MSIRHALLALLSDGPKYGFQLAQDFESGTGEMWPLNTGQVYTTLQRLQRDGLVESEETAVDGQQNVFHISDGGRRELNHWLHSPPDMSSPPRDELVIKLLVALRIPGVDIADITQVHRRHLIETMRQYTRLKEDAVDDDIALLLVADAEIFRLEAVVRWLDAADARIKRMPTPLPLPLPASSPARRPARRRAVGLRK
jgi:DNA-binding PadR family transcriptional regulator